MLRAYFDTNVYSGIVDGKVPAEDVAALESAFRRGALGAPVSPANLDELTGELDIDRGAMIRKLAVPRGFGSFQGMLKMPRDILKDAIEAYAAGIEPPPESLPENERRLVVTVMAGVIAGSRKHDAVLKQIVGGVGGLKSNWLEDMLEAQKRALTDPEWQLNVPEARPRLTFADFFAASGEGLAEAFAKSLGCVEACRARGLDGLIKIPPVRLCVGVAKSQMFSQIIGTRGQPDVRRPNRADGYDVWHAILASTADVFVTLDGRLADHIERIPDVGTVRVIRSVKALLAAIG